MYRRREISNINASLSSLKLVITRLADKALGKGDELIPYRNSPLTRILQSALGGNSKTYIICNISPATINYEETLSTLRFADEAKRVRNRAVVNETETDLLARTFIEEKQ